MITLPTLDQYVSQAVGVPVVISCESDATFDPTADGFTLTGADGSILNVLHIRDSLCVQAENVDRQRAAHPDSYITYGGERIDDESGPALQVVLHEAMHYALDSTNEGAVECAAVENRWQLVRLFKLPARVANMVMRGMAWDHALIASQFPAYGTVC